MTIQDWAAQRCTISYRAPELFNVESHCIIDERTDIWVNALYLQSFGLVCFMFFSCVSDISKPLKHGANVTVDKSLTIYSSRLLTPSVTGLCALLHDDVGGAV